MARATNSGLTSIIDPAGRVVKEIPADAPGVLIGALPVTTTLPVPWWVRRAVAYLVTVVFFAASFAPTRRNA